MPKIRYIGKKAEKADNVAGTGVIWDGNGSVREVPQNAADKLLKHPDVWELVDEKGPKSKPKPAPAEPEEGETEGEESTETEDEPQASDLPPLTNINGMDGDQLREYALREFNHTFHHKAGEQKMRDVIVGLMNRG